MQCPVLIEFLRQYGLREYLLMLSVAALCGLGVAALINAASGDVAGGQALLKTKAQLEADSSRVLTTRVFKPVRAIPSSPGGSPSRSPSRAEPPVCARAGARRAQRRHGAHPGSGAKAGRRSTVAPVPAPRPVVRAPRPAPKPAPAPKRSSGGGSQFDDSG